MYASTARVFEKNSHSSSVKVFASSGPIGGIKHCLPFLPSKLQQVVRHIMGNELIDSASGAKSSAGSLHRMQLGQALLQNVICPPETSIYPTHLRSKTPPNVDESPWIWPPPKVDLVRPLHCPVSNAMGLAGPSTCPSRSCSLSSRPKWRPPCTAACCRVPISPSPSWSGIKQLNIRNFSSTTFEKTR